MARTAQCACGELRITVTGGPHYVGLCNCLQCQRRSGSAFSYNGYWPKTGIVSIFGAHRLWQRGTDSGRGIEFHFCPTCGSTVFWYADFDQELVGIGAGSFADPNFPDPQYAEWCLSKHAWVKVPEGCNQSPGEMSSETWAGLQRR